MGLLKKLSLQTYVLLLLCIFSHSSFSVEWCVCREPPKSVECNDLCKDNPDAIIVIPDDKPKQPDTGIIEMRALWSAQSLEKYRKTNEKFRLLLETDRINSETLRKNIGTYPPSIEYKKSMTDYFAGMKHYKENMQEYRILQEAF